MNYVRRIIQWFIGLFVRTPPVPEAEPAPKRKKVPNQVLLRIIDQEGNLIIIHRGEPGPYKNGWPYIMEGHWGQPESWRRTQPQFFMPILQEELAEEYAKQGREWIWEDESWD